jgi:peptidoglycan/LPS O-acetylase OafA/YrhL
MKNHFVALDGLRGAAALAVLSMHASFDAGFAPFPYRGYLAVDFFFILSGFVVAYAYEARLRDNLKIAEFLKIRFIRLYPLIFLGIILGTLSVFLHLLALRHAPDHPPGNMNFRFLALSLALGLSILPFGPIGVSSMPLDGPLWSIMFEVYINIAYARVAKILGNRLLVIIFIISGAMLAVETYFCGSVYFGNSDQNFTLGFARVGSSFSLGIILFRLHKSGRLNFIPGFPPFLLAILLLGSFLPTSFSFGWIYDLFCTFLLFPVIIVSGAQVEHTGKWTTRIASFAGWLSYPVYVLHDPIIQHLAHVKHASEPIRAFTVVMIMVCVVIISFIATKFYDEPVRRFLMRTMRP